MKERRVEVELLRKCERAYASGRPILYIVTDERRLIDFVVGMRTLVDTDKPSSLLLPDGRLNLPDKMPLIYCEAVQFAEDRPVYPAPKDLAAYVDAYLRDAPRTLMRGSVLILYSSEMRLYGGLEPYIEMIEVSLPDDQQIEDIIRETIEEAGLKCAYPKWMIERLRGYNGSEIEAIVRRIAFSTPNAFQTEGGRAIRETIDEAKKQFIKMGGILEWLSTDDVMEPGGLRGIRDWLGNRIEAIRNGKDLQAWGVQPPKGMLLCGVPGTGKSLIAKFAASKDCCNLPLVRMDIGAIMGQYVGSSEKNMRRAIKMMEALAPCIVFIDELDKGFAAAKANASGHDGSFSRVFATFLTWMQENTKPVFIIATANDISGLPPEFFRNGRFDAAFALYMPMYDELKRIYEALLSGARSRYITEKKQRIGALEDRAAQEVQLELLRRHESSSLFSFDIGSDALLGGFIDLCLYTRISEIRDGKPMFGTARRLRERPKFVTGADVNALINAALIWLRKEAAGKGASSGEGPSVSYEQMCDALDLAITRERTHGDTACPENMDEIAALYIRLLGKNFIPASGEAAILIQKGEYQPERILDFVPESEEDRKKWAVACAVSESAGDEGAPEYDRALRRHVAMHINRVLRRWARLR